MGTFDQSKPSDPRTRKDSSEMGGGSSAVTSGSAPSVVIGPSGEPYGLPGQFIPAPVRQLTERLQFRPWSTGPTKQITPNARARRVSFSVKLSGAMFGFVTGRFVNAALPGNASLSQRWAVGAGMAIGGGLLSAATWREYPWLSGFFSGVGIAGGSIAAQATAEGLRQIDEYVEAAGSYVASGIRGADQFGSPNVFEFAGEMLNRASRDLSTSPFFRGPGWFGGPFGL